MPPRVGKKCLLRWDELYKDAHFFCDIMGQTLDQNMVVPFKKLEMDFFRKMNVYTKGSKISSSTRRQ